MNLNLHLYRSDKQDQLMKALALCHQDFKVVIQKNSKSHRNTYANLPQILMFIREFNKHGLVLIQKDIIADNEPYIVTELHHYPSGQYTISTTQIQAAPSNASLDQAYGSSSTYRRRYAAMGICGLFADNDPSDYDGEVDEEPIPEPQKSAPKDTSEEPILEAQVIYLNSLLEGHKNLKEKVLDSLKLTNLGEIKQKNFRHVCDKIKKSIPE